MFAACEVSFAWWSQAGREVQFFQLLSQQCSVKQLFSLCSLCASPTGIQVSIWPLSKGNCNFTVNPIQGTPAPEWWHIIKITFPQVNLIQLYWRWSAKDHTASLQLLLLESLQEIWQIPSTLQQGAGLLIYLVCIKVFINVHLWEAGAARRTWPLTRGMRKNVFHFLFFHHGKWNLDYRDVLFCKNTDSITRYLLIDSFLFLCFCKSLEKGSGVGVHSGKGCSPVDFKNLPNWLVMTKPILLNQN